MAGQYLEDSLTYSSCKQANILVHVSSVIYVVCFRLGNFPGV